MQLPVAVVLENWIIDASVIVSRKLSSDAAETLQGLRHFTTLRQHRKHGLKRDA